MAENWRKPLERNQASEFWILLEFLDGAMAEKQVEFGGVLSTRTRDLWELSRMSVGVKEYPQQP